MNLYKPKKWAWNKVHKIEADTFATRNDKVVFGEYGIMAKEKGLITPNMIESMRKVMTRLLKKSGNIWIRICCDLPYTDKGHASKMGKGVGKIEHWKGVVSPGQILIEISGLSSIDTVALFRKVTNKLPFKTLTAYRNDN
jgi:large subunit ribosomal protein L16